MLSGFGIVSRLEIKLKGGVVTDNVADTAELLHVQYRLGNDCEAATVFSGTTVPLFDNLGAVGLSPKKLPGLIKDDQPPLTAVT